VEPIQLPAAVLRTFQARLRAFREAMACGGPARGAAAETECGLERAATLGEAAGLYRDTGLAKAGAVWAYVEALLDGGDKLLIFAHHIEAAPPGPLPTSPTTSGPLFTRCLRLHPLATRSVGSTRREAGVSQSRSLPSPPSESAEDTPQLILFIAVFSTCVNRRTD
jgi:hypothetical protein